MKKKILLSLLTVSMCTAFLAGCGKTNVTDNRSPVATREEMEVLSEVTQAFDDAQNAETSNTETLKDSTNLDTPSEADDKTSEIDNSAKETVIITSRDGQYGINSKDPSKYNYYYGEFKLEKSEETYIVDYYYNIDNGVGNGEITVYKLGEVFVYEIYKEYDCLLNKDNTLAKITEYKINDENEMLFDTVATLYEECWESEIISDYSLDDIEKMYSEEGLEEAKKFHICVD